MDGPVLAVAGMLEATVPTLEPGRGTFEKDLISNELVIWCNGRGFIKA